MLCWFKAKATIFLRQCIPGVNFINVICANFLYERCFGSFFLVTCTYLLKAAETTFVRKICAYNVDEID